MPIAELRPEQRRKILERLAARERPNSEWAEHLTSAINCNVAGWAIAKLGDRVPPYSDATILRFAKGHAIETMLTEDAETHIAVISDLDGGKSVGTLDGWAPGKRMVIEVKCTQKSSRQLITEVTAWMEQGAGYLARAVPKNWKQARAEYRIWYDNGDGGKMRCPEHGVPLEEMKRRHPETNRARLICSECLHHDGVEQFLVKGSRDIELLVWWVTFTREELDVANQRIAWRLGQLAEDIENCAYAIGGQLPPQRWGYEYECQDCRVRDLIACPTMTLPEEMEDANLKGSITEMQKEEVPA